MSFTLTKGQDEAYGAFIAHVADPLSEVLVISGFAGTGKSTLVNKLLNDLPATIQMAKLINQGSQEWQIQLTATTNKACEALRHLTDDKFDVQTIQSFLGLRVKTNWKTGETILTPHAGAVMQENFLLLIDEASFLNETLIASIFEWTRNCKIVFIGDPAQLTPPKSSTTPAFEQGYTEARLTEVVRQAEGNPISDLATMFRNVVCGEPWQKIDVNGDSIQHLDRNTFDQLLLAEMNRPDWHHNDSKFLAWTNNTVIKYNHGLREAVSGNPELQVGDYVVCNGHFASKRVTLKTDQTVQITSMRKAKQEGIDGWDVQVDDRIGAFLPADIADKKKVMTKMKNKEMFSEMERVSRTWIDLRAAYACTINKSQGSTYDRVFIDLDDLRKCRDGTLIARLLYVASSRARHQVIFTGDF